MALVNAAERGLSLAQPLDVKDLPADGLRFEESLSAETIGELLGDATRKGPVRFKVTGAGPATVTVHPLTASEPPAVRARGKVGAELESTCVRCLETVALSLEAEIDATLFPNHDPLAGEGKEAPKAKKSKSVPVPDGEDLEVWDEEMAAPEQLGEDAYDGLKIPLPSILSEALLVELPSDPNCADEAACDARTGELIDAANAAARASDAEGDPRWAALKALKAAQAGESGSSEASEGAAAAEASVDPSHGDGKH